MSRVTLFLFVLLSSSLLSAQQPVSVTVAPPFSTVRINESRKFRATVRNNVNTAVTWSATAGVISGTGSYQPPSMLPADPVVTIRATSVADTSKSGVAVVELQNPRPSISALSPWLVNTGLAFTLRIIGAGFLPASAVTLEGASVAVRYISATELEVSLVASNLPGDHIDVVVSNPGPGAASTFARQLVVVKPVTVGVSPNVVTLRAGSTVQFRSWTQNSLVTTVDWLVDGVKGGNAAVGIISAAGLYTAPPMVPPARTVEITAVSTVDIRGVGGAEATVWNAAPVLVQASPVTAVTGPATFTLTGQLFAAGARVYLGAAELAVTSVSQNQLTASATLRPLAGQLAMIRVVNPSPGGGTSAQLPIRIENPVQVVSYATAVRFLEQASFGAEPDSIARVQAIGPRAWLAEQFQLPVTPLPDANPPTYTAGGMIQHETLGRLQNTWLLNALQAPDQLRHRVAFALHSILLVSGIDIYQHRQYVPYLRILHENAFGNYRTLLSQITRNPGMGRYLNMLNNAKSNPITNTVANENYAREFLQLFTIGITPLNPDGTPREGRPPNYTEFHVKELAKAFTGWTFAPLPGAAPEFRGPANWDEPMVPIEHQHDVSAKELPNGITLAPSRTAEQDLTDALDAVFNHPNVGPFVSYRLIQRLVTSNPSPAYVGRVASVFDHDAIGVRGNLKAVIEAILTDPEAGTNTAQAPELDSSQGNLREPVALTLNVIRALEIDSNGPLAAYISLMGQTPFMPVSVFSYYSPFAKPGPEFEGLSASQAQNTINIMFLLIANGMGSAATFDLAPWELLANDSNALVAAAANALVRGDLPDSERSVILQAVNAQPTVRLKAMTALYLIAASPRFLVKR